MRLLMRILINAVALWVAVQVVTGIDYSGEVLPFLIVAVIFGLVNSLIRPIVMVLSCPLRAITLGLFTLVVNAAMLWLTAVIAQWAGLDFVVGGDGWLNTFGNALLGSIVISIVSMVLSVFLPDKEK